MAYRMRTKITVSYSSNFAAIRGNLPGPCRNYISYHMGDKFPGSCMNVIPYEKQIYRNSRVIATNYFIAMRDNFLGPCRNITPYQKII
jgi:hypothetical protein